MWHISYLVNNSVNEINNHMNWRLIDFKSIGGIDCKVQAYSVKKREKKSLRSIGT